MDPNWDVILVFGSARFAGTRWFTGYALGWRPLPLSHDELPSAAESIEQLIGSVSRLSQWMWGVVVVLLVWGPASFSTIVRLTIAGIYAAPSRAGAYAVVVLGALVLTWPGLAGFALLPRMLTESALLNRQLFRLAEAARVDDSVTTLLRTTLAVGKLPRLQIVVGGGRAFTRALDRSDRAAQQADQADGQKGVG